MLDIGLLLGVLRVVLLEANAVPVATFVSVAMVAWEGFCHSRGV